MTRNLRLKPGERYALIVLENTTGGVVHLHDDGSQNGMYDFDLVLPSGQVDAVEVVAAVDPGSIELHKLLRKRPDLNNSPLLDGGWELELSPKARAKDLAKSLIPTLVEAEKLKIVHYEQSWNGNRPRENTESALFDLGVLSASQGPTSVPGSIYTTVRYFAKVAHPSEEYGIVPETNRFLASNLRSDVPGKLQLATAANKHAFLVVPSYSEFSKVMIDLLFYGSTTPTEDLQPPEPITDVWVALDYWPGEVVCHWSDETGWQRFSNQ